MSALQNNEGNILFRNLCDNNFCYRHLNNSNLQQRQKEY